MHRPSLFALALIGAALIPLAPAQTVPSDNPEWSETEAPPPPVVRLDKLVPLDVDARGSLRYGVDASSLSIGPDGVVRYVMVAQSSGAMTAMYEGLRCSTAEYKVYARYNSGQWTPVASPEWRSVRASSRVQHPQAFAKQGGCDNKAQPTTVQQIVQRLRSTGLPHHYP